MAVLVLDNDRPPSARRGRSRAVAIAVSAALGLMAVTGPGTSAQSTITVVSGAGEGTVAGNAYMPGDITVATGDSVTFTIGSDEGHTITFGEGPADVPPPFWPVAGFEAPPEGAAPPPDMGTASIDDSPFINTGIIVKGTSATVEFSTAGTYPFYCAIHPGMSGQVTVVDDGVTTTQADADAAVEATSGDLLAQVEPIHQERLDSVSTVDNPDGSQTWNVFADASTSAGPVAGGGSGYLELLQFIPNAIRIEPGDTISWTASQIHTVTFLPEGMDPAELFTSEEVALSPMGSSTYDGSVPASSGVLNFPLAPDMPAVTEYSLTFPEPGLYPFFCVLHAELGQIGVVAVGVDLPDISA